MPRADKEATEIGEEIGEEQQSQQLAMSFAGPSASLLAGLGGPIPEPIPKTGFMATYGDVFDDIDDIQERGAKYKRMQLAQGQSKAVAIDQTARAGEYIVDNFDGFKSVVIMPFSYRQQRQFWRKPLNLDEDVDPRMVRDEMACSSQIRVMKRSEPALFGSGDPGGECGTCPMQSWTPGANGKNRPPLCTLIHIIDAVSLEHGCRVEIPFKKTSERTALDLLNIIRTRGMGQVLFQLGAESDKNAAGQPFWKATFKVIEATELMVEKGADILRRERESVGY